MPAPPPTLAASVDGGTVSDSVSEPESEATPRETGAVTNMRPPAQAVTPGAVPDGIAGGTRPAPRDRTEAGRKKSGGLGNRYAQPRPRVISPGTRLRSARFSGSATRKTAPGRARARSRAVPGPARSRLRPRISRRVPHKAPVARLPFEDYLELAPHLDGEASWYGPGFHRKKTANGETYNQYGLTAAHRLLPMGTRVLVENLETGAKVHVRINDRGPYKKGRIIDLSRSAAIRLGMMQKGTAPVRVTIARWPTGMDPALGIRAYRQFVVQVGAFPSAATAETRRQDLDTRFGQVDFQLDRTSKGLFAIVAGPYDDEGVARAVASHLQQNGISNLVRSYRK